jgi:GT2 family glycosyltransferase
MTDSEFFFKLDDDCTLLPQTLPLLVLTYSLTRSTGFPLGVLAADVIGVGKAQGPFYEVEVAPGFMLECAPCVGGGCVLISREVLEDVGPFRADRLYGVEDGDFAARARAKGYYNAYLRGAYHISRCRGDEADPEIDAWKHEYYFGRTDKPFDEWRGTK